MHIFINHYKKGFNVLTSCREFDEDPLKCALGVNYELQVNAINDIIDLYETLQFEGGRKKFQYGGIICARATIWLHKTLRDTYGVKYLLCERILQDYVEREFSILRGMGSADTNPSALHALFRLQRQITSLLLDVPQKNHFHLSALLC